MTTGDRTEAAQPASAEARATSPSESPRAEAARVLPPKNRWRPSARTAVEVAAFVAVYALVSGYQGRHLLATDAIAPAFTLTSLDGPDVSLESLRGKRVLVHFWATWCGVCRQEFGALDAIERGLGPDEALISVVADSEDPSRLRAFVAKEHIQYPVLLGNDAAIRAFHVSAFPTNYFLDRDGRISGHTVGMSTRFSLAARLALARW